MLKSFILTLSSFILIDLVWLGLVARNFYNQHLQAFARTTRWPVLPLIYLVLTAGIVLFVLPKAGESPKLALLYGTIFGLITYGVYDLVNFATLKDWSLTMVVVDVLWGMLLCGVVALIVTYLGNLPPFRA